MITSYSELLSNYDDNQGIPYDELLNTNEWKVRRDSILIRDKACCTKCGITKSIQCNDKNVYLVIDSNDGLSKLDIGKEYYTLENAKKTFEFERIHLKELENSIVGISENNLIFLVDSDQLEDFKNSKREDIFVQKCVTKRGRKYYILSIIGKDINFQRISIPVITENRIELHVHHKFYIINKLPWEYEDDDLITLCNVCHMALHEQSNIPIYQMVNGRLEELKYTPCTRCNGVGYFPEYKNVQNGICFRCHGKRYEELI